MRAFLVSALLLLTSPTVAQEKFIGSNVELRTFLAFKAPDAAVQKMLPDGWEVSPPRAGPAKGFNVAIVFYDQQIAHDVDGKPIPTYRGAVLISPSKKKGTDTTGVMVIGGLVEQAAAPGPYGVTTPAQSAIERKTLTGPDDKSTIEESWQFKAADGNSIELQIQFARDPVPKAKQELKVFSAAKPDFFRIYRVEQVVDVVRSTPTGVDRVRKFSFKASGDKMKSLFDGTEQLISVSSLPWYSRQIYLPGS